MPDPKVKQVNHEILTRLSTQRGSKYKGILRGLSLAKPVFAITSFGNLELARLRSELLVTFYVAMRYIDDIVDGDFQLPSTSSSRTYYINQRIRFAREGTSPNDDADYLLLYCLSIAEKLGITISSETDSILRSMLFDAVRIEEGEKEGGIGRICTRYELDHYFHELDITGTASGMLKIFGDDGARAYLLKPIGTAHRTKLTLQDLVEDINGKLINIPAEDLDNYSISTSALRYVSTLPKGIDIALNHPEILPREVSEWVSAQASLGLSYLNQQRAILKEEQFKRTGLFVLHWMYTVPVERYLRRIVAPKK